MSYYFVYHSVNEALTSQGRPRMGVPGKPTDDYQVVLKKRFEARIGNPDWARLNRKIRDDEEDLLKVCIISSLIFNPLGIRREFACCLLNLLSYMVDRQF